MHCPPDMRMTLGVIVTIVLQTGAAMLWAGAAAERLNSLERHAQEQRPISERLARVEAELDAMRAQLDRIEDKI